MMTTIMRRYRCTHILKKIGILANQQNLTSQNLCKVKGAHTENGSQGSEDKHGSSVDDSESNTSMPVQRFNGLKSRDLRRKRLLSPTARLLAALPEEYTRDCADNVSSMNETANETTEEADTTNESIDESRTSYNESLGVLKTEEECNKSSARNRSDIEVDGGHRSHRGRKSSLQPATRLSSLLPKEYWQSVSDTDTKQSIDGISNTGQTADKDE